MSFIFNVVLELFQFRFYLQNVAMKFVSVTENLHSKRNKCWRVD